MDYNVLFTLNRTTHSSKTLLCVVRFNVNKTLFNDYGLQILEAIIYKEIARFDNQMTQMDMNVQ